MDLKRLRYFCAAIEHGNITKAARALNIAQPPLSKRLHELEEEIGAPLFLRGAKQIEPTPAGLHLYHRACEILRDVEEAARKTAQIAATQTRQLRIGLTHLYQNYFGPLILGLAQADPETQVSVMVADSGHLELLLKRGLIDVALTQKPANVRSYDCQVFSPIRPVAAVSRVLLGHEPRSVLSIADLGRLPLVLLRRAEGGGTVELLLDRIQSAGVGAHVIMYVSQPGVIIDLINAGLDGATLLPETEVDRSAVGRYAVLDISGVPEIFFPSIITLKTAPRVDEIMALAGNKYT